jgi:hypothetical protein
MARPVWPQRPARVNVARGSREYHRVVGLGYALTGSWWLAEDLAIALFYLQGWRSSEIAAVLGCSDATVRVHLHRGRETLARQLGETAEEAK